MTKYSLSNKISELSKILLKRNWLCSTAESCTGGLLGATFTSMHGASSWYAGGFITYSNELKQTLLCVPKQIIERYGAVSEQCVIHMAEGACKATNTEISIAISGIAGPDGGSIEKPVGTVWIGFSVHGILSSQLLQLIGDRAEIRNQATELAVLGIIKRINEKSTL